MSNNDGKVVDIGAAIKQAQQDVSQGLPPDISKLAIWRKDLPAPTTFIVQESEGRRVIEDWKEGKAIEFQTYNDGSGRRNVTHFRSEDVSGLTLEFATIKLASAG